LKSKQTLASYIALALTWGASFLFMKIGLEGLSPSQVVLGRLGIGALTLLILMAVTGRRWPRELKIYLHLAIVGLLLCVFPFLLFAWSGQYLPSGLSSILNATTPFMTALFSALLLPGNRLTRFQTLGIFIGAIGVAVVMGLWNIITDPAFVSSVPAQFGCLGATACYGIAFVYMQAFLSGKHKYDSLTISSIQIVIGAIEIGVISLFLAHPTIHLSTSVISSIVILGAFGTGIAYIWNTKIVMNWGATAASTVTYLTPLVGVILGIIFLNEQFFWYQPIGGIIVVIGILIVQNVIKSPETRKKKNNLTMK
jgi:drug/metabolite transporter (DMT)-like permease